MARDLGWIDGLRQMARQAIGDNALVLAAAPSPAKQWWNIPAKDAAAHQIADEELHEYPGRNDIGDAMRHARWSQRMATEIDPVSAKLAGAEHEIVNLAQAAGAVAGRHLMRRAAVPVEITSMPQAVAESIMDLHNNAEGRRAAEEGRPIDPSRLTILPISPSSYGQGAPSAAAYNPTLRYPPYR
jgi:hypothetical protein